MIRGLRASNAFGWGTRYQVREIVRGGSEMEAECGVSIARLHTTPQRRGMQGKL